jgi:HEAT repeat protein
MKTVTALLVVLVISLNANTGLQAQSSKYSNITKNSIETLKRGIESDNTGLRKSSIYLAGFYKINEAVDVLIEQLEKEQNPGTKILIALSLYNIGNPEGMEAVKELAVSDKNNEVKRMSTALYMQFVDDNE